MVRFILFGIFVILFIGLGRILYTQFQTPAPVPQTVAPSFTAREREWCTDEGGLAAKAATSRDYGATQEATRALLLAPTSRAGDSDVTPAARAGVTKFVNMIIDDVFSRPNLRPSEAAKEWEHTCLTVFTEASAENRRRMNDNIIATGRY